MKTTKITSFFYTCLLFSALLVMSSCGGVTYSIDNPTNSDIKVSIDGNEPITIGAMEFKKIDGTLAEGEHTMKVGDGEEIKFNLDKDHVMLNPTLSSYIIASQEYSTTGAGASTLTTSVIEIDGDKYEGAFELIEAAPFIFTGDLNFAVDAPFKDEITGSSTGVVVLRKIFRKSDFVKEFD